MKIIAFILLGIVMVYGIYLAFIVKEKFDFVDKAIIENAEINDNKSVKTQKNELPRGRAVGVSTA